MPRTIVRKLKYELEQNDDTENEVVIEVSVKSNHANPQFDVLLDMIEGNIKTLHNYSKKTKEKPQPKSKNK